MAVSGLRRGEAAGLRWCDIDVAAGTVTSDSQVHPAHPHASDSCGQSCGRPRARRLAAGRDRL
jgi:integrase